MFTSLLGLSCLDSSYQDSDFLSFSSVEHLLRWFKKEVVSSQNIGYWTEERKQNDEVKLKCNMLRIDCLEENLFGGIRFVRYVLTLHKY